MSLIDTIVASALMLVVFVGITSAFRLSVEVVTNNKARAGAIALANERMEYIRSLAYSSVGTAGGVPTGSIAQSETVTMGNVPYTRRTTIFYVDDPGDGVGLADANSIVEDYKVARVDVSWNSRQGNRHVTLVARIEPRNGMEVACTSCGTLAITVVDAAAQPLSGAQVHIVNAASSVNITTYANASGKVAVVGAPAASGYQVTATDTGYSTDQTYAVSLQNPNPVPGNLTVANGQTTAATFAIDQLSSVNVLTWSPIRADSWNDDLDNGSKVATFANVEVSGGRAQLSQTAGVYASSGTMQSISISPSAVARWNTLSLTETIPSGTGLIAQVYDGGGSALVPDAQLPGNSTGLSGTLIDLSGISTSTYSSIRVQFHLTSTDSAVTPLLAAYSVTYAYGPVALPSISFDMRGSKTIGAGPPPLYKYNQHLATAVSGSVVLPNIEWDTYTISLPSGSGLDSASTCSFLPLSVSPDTAVVRNLYLATHTNDSLLVGVVAAGVPVTNASVSIWKNGTATTTLPVNACGEAFWGGLSAANYWLQVTAAGHATYINTNAVSGATQTSVTLN